MLFNNKYLKLKKKMDKKEKFINKAIIKFGDKFNYEEIDYINSTTKIKMADINRPFFY
jgi:hypothetical protein